MDSEEAQGIAPENQYIDETGQYKGIFYGWFVLAACFATTCTMGEAFWAFGVYVAPLEAEFGWSRSLISSAYSVSILSYAFSAFFLGKLSDQHGPRWVLFASGLITASGLALCSIADSIWQLRLFFLFVGLGAGATFSVPAAIVQRWFHKYRGMAVGIVSSGVGVGAVTFAPLTSWLISLYGWRTTFIITGIVYGTIIVSSSLLMVASPDRKGLKPYGVKLSSPASKPMKSWKTSVAIRTTPFIILVIVFTLALLSSHTFLVHLVPYAIDNQIPRTVAASALGLIGGFSVLGRLGVGLLSDRLGWKRAMVIAYFGSSIATLWLIGVSNLWMVYAFVIMYGICHGGRVSAVLGLLGSFFGTTNLAQLIGIVSGIAMGIGGFGPYIAGFLYDVTGSYLIPFTLAAASLALGGLIILSIQPPSDG